MDRYQTKLRALLSPDERRIFTKLSTPKKIQDFLDSFPVLHLRRGEHSMKSPRGVLKVRRAHCMEGAMLAAASLAYHGREALLLDLQSTDNDLDHVVALFKENGRWGAVSKTNHPVLRYRDAVYESVRELAMSYFHEYFLDSGKKTLRAYSRPFNLKKYKPELWVMAEGDIDWLAEALDDSPHSPIAPAKNVKLLRKASKLEIKSTKAVEWKNRAK